MAILCKPLLKRVLGEAPNAADPVLRKRCGRFEAYLSIVLNVTIFAVKMALAAMVGSASLVADAVHSLSDSATSIILLIGFALAGQPADRKHPYGHQRMELITALIIAVLLVVAGVELIHLGIDRLAAPSAESHVFSYLVVAILIATVAVKLWMAALSNALGAAIDSTALAADGAHHRSDALSTVVVIAALIGRSFGYGWIDGAATLLVAGMIIRDGWGIARKAVGPLLGESLESEYLQSVERIASEISGILGVHEVLVHQYGQVRVISLHIEVAENVGMCESHDIGERLESALSRQLGLTAVVHVDPVNVNHPLYHDIQATLAEIVTRDDRLLSFHDVRIVGRDDHGGVVFNAVINPAKGGDVMTIRADLRQAFTRVFPGMHLAVKFKQPYGHDHTLDAGCDPQRTKGPTLT